MVAGCENNLVKMYTRARVTPGSFKAYFFRSGICVLSPHGRSQQAKYYQCPHHTAPLPFYNLVCALLVVRINWGRIVRVHLNGAVPNASSTSSNRAKNIKL